MNPPPASPQPNPNKQSNPNQQPQQQPWQQQPYSPTATTQQMPPQMGAPAWTPPNGQAKKPATFAIIALVVGIIAFLTGLVPVLGLLLGAAGIALGIIALVKKQSKGMAIAALVLSGLAFIASAGTTAALGSIAGNVDSQSAPVAVESTEPSEAADEPAEVVEEPAVVEETEEPAAPAPAPEPEEPEVPAEYTSALDQADTYSNYMYMSKAGVYDQLVSEYGGQFTPEAAQYAIDNVESDWNNNALQSAKTYQETMSMSPAAIYDQLVSEYGGQFLPSEADYAIAHLND